ncbi:hypothetical protein QEN19_000466 [Hanseniaspora menglaensis]
MLRRSSLMSLSRHFVRSQSDFVKPLAAIDTKTFTELYEPKLTTDFLPLDTFAKRHLGTSPEEVSTMLKQLKQSDLETFIKSVVCKDVLIQRPLDFKILEDNNVGDVALGLSESEMLANLKNIAKLNAHEYKNFIGKGYYGTNLPLVIQRNLLECPEWYTSYTPYQAEISQGRLESLLNFQTLVTDLTGLEISNASLLDEGTAAGEALLVAYHFLKGKKKTFILDKNLHLQTKNVIKSRGDAFHINFVEIDFLAMEKEGKDVNLVLNEKLLADSFGCMVQYPGSNGNILKKETLSKIGDLIHSKKGLYITATDLLALTILEPPSSFNSDICLGSSQRFGFPTGFGGPHAAFFSCNKQLSRKIPGRIVGVSKGRLGERALRLALQTREQHIKRDKATSNICTAQCLGANVAAMYAVYHGPQGLQNIAKRVYAMTYILSEHIKNYGSNIFTVATGENFFDTLTIKLKEGNGIFKSVDEVMNLAKQEHKINLYKVDNSTVSLSFDETVTIRELKALSKIFGSDVAIDTKELYKMDYPVIENQRPLNFLKQPVFNQHHSETSMLRYLHKLQSKDVSLANSMIPLGSCTMKLNPTTAMVPITWPEFTNIHPFQPRDQVKGYEKLIREISQYIATVTGLPGVSLQPHSGSAGEYAGLRVIRQFLLEQDSKKKRQICLIPVSAHGTNPASAAMCGFKVVPVKCLDDGSLDLIDLKAKAEKHADELACSMITYPSTYGIFETGIKEAIDIVHQNGGLVYLDGANMNAQVGLTSPGDLGADVVHLNLHKTFAICHAGGGPGVGPIAVSKDLTPYLPGNEITGLLHSEETGKEILAISSTAYGNAPLLAISYAYMKMMGEKGLPYASIIAILNANYMKSKLQEHYPILFLKDDTAHCAHEFIIDLREFEKKGVKAIDVSKRLQDYGFHSPTLAFPVPGTLMVEPTESENLKELDRFCDAMISIRKEIDWFLAGDERGQVLPNSPHTLHDLILNGNKYSDEYKKIAAFPLKDQQLNAEFWKQWPTVTRIDDTYGDLNLMCTCPSVEEVVNSQEE